MALQNIGQYEIDQPCAIMSSSDLGMDATMDLGQQAPKKFQQASQSTGTTATENNNAYNKTEPAAGNSKKPECGDVG